MSATVTDEGGIVDDDKDPKTSDPGSEQIKIYPKKPEITVDAKDGSVTITPIEKDKDRVAKKMDITYTPAGSDTTKTVIAERDNDGKWSVPEGTDFKVSDDGKSITITNDKIKSKTDITAKTNDGDADPEKVLKSDPETKQVPDKTAPKPPTVEVNTTDGTAHITPPADPDVKTIEVKYPGADGNEKKFTATKTDTGWEISGDNGVTFEMSGYISIPYDKLKKADTISATATDEDGNKSTEGIDISLPPAPTAKESEGVVTITPPTEAAVNGMEITYTPADSEVEKTLKVVKGNDDKWKIDGETSTGVTVNDNGTVTIADGTAKENTKVTAISSIDTNKKSLDKGEATVPESKVPEAPAVKVQEDGSVKITPQNKGETTVTVTYNKGDGSPIKVEAKKVGGKWTIENPTNGESVDKTSGVIIIPTGNTNPGDRVRATASKGSKTSKENNDLTKPAPPTVTPDQKSGNVTITPPTKGNVDGMIIKYKKPDGSEGTIKVKKGEGGTWTFEGDAPEGVSVAGDTGIVTIANGHAKEKTPVTADSTIETLQTPDKNQGEQPELVPDKTAPTPPTVAVDTANGNVTITPPTDKDTTSVTVKYKDANDAEKSLTAKKGKNGTWTIKNNENDETIDATSGIITIPYEKLKKADTVSATAKDEAGNESQSSTDTTLPPVPTVTPNETSGDVTVTPPTDKAPAVDGMEITYTPAGSEETKTLKVVKGNDSNWKIDGEAPENVTIDAGSGLVTFKAGTAKANTNVIARSKIGEDKKGLETAEGKVPNITPPDAPEVKVQEDGSVKITPKNKGETTVTVTYKDQDGQDKTATATKGKNGKWSVDGTNGEEINEDSGVITIPTGKTNPGDDIKATAKKGSKTSGPGQDFTKPAPPTVTPDKKTGNVTITPPTKGKVDGMVITYKDPENKDKTVKVKKGDDGTWTFEGDAPEGVAVNGSTGVVTIPKGKAKEKTEVVANSTKGDKLAPAEKTPENQNLVPDKTAPNTPTVALDNATDNMTITPPADEDTTSVTVTYKKADNTEIKVRAKKAGNKWSLTKEDGNPVDNGESVNETSGVITIPKGNYKLGEAVSAYGNDNADNKSSDDTQTPVEVSFDMDGGKQNIDSSILVQGGSFVLPAIYAPEYFPEGKEFAGWMVGNSRKKAGDSITIDANTKVRALWRDKGTPGTPDPQDPANPEKPAEQPKNHYYKASTLIIPNRTPEPVEPAKEMEIGRHIRYLYGYEDRTVRPQGKITRAEAAALIARLAELDMSDKSKPDFADTPSAWYNSAINIMVKKDLMFGDKNGNFHPNEPITRGEFARALLYIDTRNDKVAPFADVKGHQFEAAINQAFGNGRINGYPDGTFRPDDYIQRAEAARMLNQYANRGTTLEGMAPVAKDLARFTDIDESHWAYCEIMEAANSHEYQRVKGTQAETWLKILYDDMKK